MKDAKGHGSNPRGAHSSGIDKIAGPEKLVPIAGLRPRPENTAMLAKLDRQETASEEAFKAAYPGESFTRHGPTEDVANYTAAIKSGANMPPLAIHKDGPDRGRRTALPRAQGRRGDARQGPGLALVTATVYKDRIEVGS